MDTNEKESITSQQNTKEQIKAKFLADKARFITAGVQPYLLVSCLLLFASLVCKNPLNSMLSRLHYIIILLQLLFGCLRTLMNA